MIFTDRDRFQDAVGNSPPTLHSHHLEQLQKRFQPERTRADRILVEVGVEEPFFGIDKLAATDKTEAGRPTIGGIQLNLVDHAQLLFRERGLNRISKGFSRFYFLRSRLIRLSVAYTNLLGE